MMRTAIRDFVLANELYAGAVLQFWRVAAGIKTAVLVTLYSAPTGTGTLENPQTLTSDGRLQQAVYIDEPVIITVNGITVGAHDTGVINPLPTFRVDEATGKFQYSYDGVLWNDTGDYIFKYRGAWTTATVYNRNDLSIQAGVLYFCAIPHTSGVFATDLAAGKWVALITLTTANIAGISTYMQTLLDDVDAATARATLGALGAELITAGDLTMNTGKLLGRSTAAAGAIEEIVPGTGISLVAGVLTATSAALPDFLLTFRGFY